MQFRQSPTFQRNISPSSGSKSNPRKKLTEGKLMELNVDENAKVMVQHFGG
jgi:hypothetical protein